MIVKMYRIEGMNCGGCVAAVKTALKAVPGVIEAQVQLKEPEAIISMENDLPSGQLQRAVAGAGNYRLSGLDEGQEEREAPGKKRGKAAGLFSLKKSCCK